MWFPEFREEGGGVYRGFLTLRLLLVAQNRVAPWGNGNAGAIPRNWDRCSQLC